jgi:hypothetical protein
MQTNISTCDRCKTAATTKEEKEKQDILTVAIGVWNQRYTSYSQSNFEPKDAMHKVEWCKDCREAMGLFYHHPDKPVPSPNPSIEDLIREIATEAAQEAVHN